MKKVKIYLITSVVLIGVILSLSGFFWRFEKSVLSRYLKDEDISASQIVVVTLTEENFRERELWPWGSNWLDYLITYILDFKPNKLVLNPDFVESAKDIKGFNKFLQNDKVIIPFAENIKDLKTEFKTHMVYGKENGLLYSFTNYKDMPSVDFALKGDGERAALSKRGKFYFLLQENVRVVPASNIALFGMLKKEGYRDNNIADLSNSIVFLSKDGGSLPELYSFLYALLNHRTFSVLPVEFTIYIGIFIFSIVCIMLKSLKFKHLFIIFSLIFFGWFAFQRLYFTISRNYIELIPVSIFALLALAVVVFEKEYNSRVCKKERKDTQLARLLKEREVLPNAVLSSNGALVSVNRYKMDFVGGDFYQFLEFSKGELGVVIGWVPGSGIERVEYIMEVVHSWRDFASVYKEPSKVIQVLNNSMFRYAEQAKYATLAYVLYDAKKSNLRYVNAGHDPLIFVNGDGVVNILAAEEPTPLGIARDVPFKEEEVSVKGNAMLIGYSGGIAKILSRSGGITDKFLGHLKDCLKDKRERVTDDIFKEFLNYCSKKPEEEWSLLTLKITA
ncbi:MAG: PP2C family protein-serine/threonine phosphatase [Candidatus Kaelpia imicola]|nr:PP2C family protein-serine/threonine phosphatase [Candidatus Kaelpia imicola]